MENKIVFWCNSCKKMIQLNMLDGKYDASNMDVDTSGNIACINCDKKYSRQEFYDNLFYELGGFTYLPHELNSSSVKKLNSNAYINNTLIMKKDINDYGTKIFTKCGLDYDITIDKLAKDLLCPISSIIKQSNINNKNYEQLYCAVKKLNMLSKILEEYIINKYAQNDFDKDVIKNWDEKYLLNQHSQLAHDGYLASGDLYTSSPDHIIKYRDDDCDELELDYSFTNYGKIDLKIVSLTIATNNPDVNLTFDCEDGVGKSILTLDDYKSWLGICGDIVLSENDMKLICPHLILPESISNGYGYIIVDVKFDNGQKFSKYHTFSIK